MMRRQMPLDKIAEAMLDQLCSPNINMTGGLGCDNMSLIIIDFRKAPTMPIQAKSPTQLLAPSPAKSVISIKLNGTKI